MLSAKLSLLLMVVLFANSAVFSGSIDSDKDMVFLGRFCYGINQWVVDEQYPYYTFTASTTQPGQRFAMYDDEKDSWATVYKNDSKTCKEKLAACKGGTGFEIVTDAVDRSMISEKLRPRVWYAAVFNCETDQGIHLDSYTLTMVNSGENQFGVNDYGVLPLYLVGTVVYSLAGLFFLRYTLIRGWRTVVSHPFVLMLWAVYAMQLASLGLLLLDNFLYAADGQGWSLFRAGGEMADDAFTFFLTALVLLIAKGWTITFPNITRRSHLFGALGMFLFLYFMLFVSERVGRDPAATTFVYESVPGFLLVVMRVVCFLYFLYALKNTMYHEEREDKLEFYRRFRVLFGVWFLSRPVLVFVGTLLDPWVRAKCLAGMELTFHSIAITILVYILWPIFRFHWDTFSLEALHSAFPMASPVASAFSL